MKVTLSIIKADIGSIGGHICPSRQVLESVRSHIALCLSACFSRPQWVVSWDASTEFPQEPAAVPTTVCQRGRLRGVSDGMPLARRVPVSEVRSDVRVRLGRPPALAVCLLPLSGLCDGRDNPPQFEDPAHDVVLGCVSDDDG